LNPASSCADKWIPSIQKPGGGASAAGAAAGAGAVVVAAGADGVAGAVVCAIAGAATVVTAVAATSHAPCQSLLRDICHSILLGVDVPKLSYLFV
jgi:hypothetical protein